MVSSPTASKYAALLRQQYAPRGVYAGASHFRDVWARDAFFASFGCIGIGEVAHARDTVQFFLDHMRHDGLVPIRIGAKDQVLNYLKLSFRHGAVYTQDKGRNHAVDPNLLLLILADAVERAGGKRFNRAELACVAHWIVARLGADGLLHQGPYADWEDSIKTRGSRLYTSVCLARALRAAATLLNDKTYAKRATTVERAVQSWWTGTYFMDGPCELRFMTAGNLLAIIWGIATKQQAQSILKRLARRTTVCPPSGYFKPSIRSVYAPFFLIGLADYHASMEWSWLAPLEALAYDAVGEKIEASHRRERFDALVQKHSSVFEVYEHDVPVNRIVYRSERDFGWAIGIRCAKTL